MRKKFLGIFDEKLIKLEIIITEKDEEIQKCLRKVNEMEVKIDTLETSDETNNLEERLHAYEKHKIIILNQS
jgi:uncharacterized protein YhaN